MLVCRGYGILLFPILVDSELLGGIPIYRGGVCLLLCGNLNYYTEHEELCQIWITDNANYADFYLHRLLG